MENRTNVSKVHSNILNGLVVKVSAKRSSQMAFSFVDEKRTMCLDRKGVERTVWMIGLIIKTQYYIYLGIV